jgi:hypothetical protein
MKISIMLHTLIVLVLVIFVGAFAWGYHLHGSPPPAPTVTAAVAHAAVATTAAVKAESTARVTQHVATAAIATYDAVRKRDTVVVNSIVYVPAAPADTVTRACTDAIATDNVALTLGDTARSAVAAVVAAQVAARPSRIGVVVTGAYEPITRLVSARAETVVRITDRFAIGGEASRGFSRTDPARLSVLAHWTFR